MRIRHHHVTLLDVVLTIAVIVFIFVSALPRIRGVSKDETKSIAVASIVQSQSVPNPSCNPAPGQGHIGVCAPVQAMAYANILGKAAGDPDDVSALGPIGVDVSNNNGCSFSLARAKFVWFKAGEGTYFTDRCAAGYVAQAKRLGIPYGGYEFVRPGHASAKAEAAAFAHRLYLAHALGAQLPPVADVEVNDRGLSPTALNTWACAFVKAARGYLHRRVDIYTGYWFWRGGDCGAELWEAAYAPYPIVPGAWASKHGWRHDVTTWQHSDGRFGPSPHLGADTDVMLHPERYGLRVVRDRLVKPVLPKPKPKPAPKPVPAPKPLKGKARARAQLARRRALAAIRSRHCSRHRSRGDCQRLYRHNATLKKELGIR